MEWLTSNNTCWKKRQDANMLSDIVKAMSQNGFKFSKPDAKLPYFWEIITVGSRTAAPAKVTSTIWAIHVVAATILNESMCLESCVTPTMTLMSGHIIVALQNKNQNPWKNPANQ